MEYHIKYVCLEHRQDLTDIEHRLRVQEFLQYARARRLQDLAADTRVTAYFHTRCAICNCFCTTVQGLLQHWKTEHTNLFLKHEPVNDELLSILVPTNPCELCGQTFKQYHKCHIVRQLALILVADGYDCPTAPPADLHCEHCGKAYTTRHGLQQHMQIYHDAEQARLEPDAQELEVHCLVFEAVQNDRIDDLLGIEAIQFFLATQCLSCRKAFSRKNELKRHLRLHHSSEWNECESRAMSLDAKHKPVLGCLCHPPSYQKHICVFYLQYALLRIDLERQRAPQIMALPPDQLLSISEQIEPVLWLGFPQFLYQKTELRVNLTVQCQICGWSGTSAEELQQHLHALHAENLQAVQSLKELFQWSMFGELGCFCNPGPGWGAPDHECVGLTQLAILANDYQWPLVLPWSFCSTDLVQLLGDLLPLPKLKTVCMDLMTRNFHRLWNDRDLLWMLSTRCLLCQEAVELRHIKAHLFVAHRVDATRVKCLTQQLSWVYADLLTDEHHCDWCNEVLPFYFNDMDAVMDPVGHLNTCPMVIQMALLLMMPRWSKPSYQPFTWPSQDDIEAGHRQLALKLWQFNARPSDTYGADLDLLAKCGLELLQDAWIAGRVSYQCLLCGKTFFLPHKFETHLHMQHNFMQFRTLMCLHRLELTCETPCQYCHFPQHSKSCLPLLNLAVFLINGHGVRGARWARCGRGSVGQSAHEGTALRPEHSQPSRPGEQTTTSQQHQGEESTSAQRLGVGAQADSGSIDTPGVEARGHTQLNPDGSTVCPLHLPGTGLSAARALDAEPTMASGRSDGASETSPGAHDDYSSGNAIGQVDESRIHSRTLRRVRQTPSDHSRAHNAVLAMGSETEGTGAEQISRLACSTGSAVPGEYPSDPGRLLHNTEIPCLEKDQSRRDASRSHTVDLDHINETARSVGGTICTFLPQYLASCASSTQTTNDGAAASGETVAADPDDVKVVRILLNPTGTICYANTVILCLAWMTLLANGLHRSLWRFGFELFRNVTAYSPIPMDLSRHQPFLWLLKGVGVLTVEALQSQQDVREFCTALLHWLQPRFIHCGWLVKPALMADWGATLLDEQKGHRFTPIQLPFINYRDDSCLLQDLIEAWHDDQGLCKGIAEVGNQLILAVDRPLDNPGLGADAKCLQRIDIPDNCIHFPCFSNLSGDVDMIMFEICGLIYHIGSSPHSGHYRAALRYNGSWLIYDDGKVPEQVDELSDTILRNVTLFWCIIPNPCTDRTMNANENLLGSRSATIQYGYQP